MVYGGNARKLVLGLKHGDRQDLAAPAAHWMTRALDDVPTEGALVAPIPLHRWRLLRRRYNQAALLARGIARNLGEAYCPDLLTRTRATPTLDGKSVEERFEALHGAIAVAEKKRPLIEGRHVLLVDDVMTAGATLTAASTACLQAGATDVSVVTLARAVKGA